jgi:hypothetical protein
VRFRRIVSHPTEAGYWLVDHVGGVFSFGDANFHGSLPGVDMAAHPADLVPTADGDGYVIVATDGRHVGFGTARDVGIRTHGHAGVGPIVAAVEAATDGSYLAVDRDGIVVPCGAAPFLGSPVTQRTPVQAIGIETAATVASNDDPLSHLKLPLERRHFSSR